MWYRDVIGGGRCPIVDTWWQTETGGDHDLAAAGRDADQAGQRDAAAAGHRGGGAGQARATRCRRAQGGLLFITRPWPSMLRTVYGDPERYEKTYFSELPGMYFTGDGARKDEDGYFWVMGRVDDVMNVAGHRLGTAEVESALVSHPQRRRGGGGGPADELKGTALVAFVTLKKGIEADARR